MINWPSIAQPPAMWRTSELARRDGARARKRSTEAWFLQGGRRKIETEARYNGSRFATATAARSERRLCRYALRIRQKLARCPRGGDESGAGARASTHCAPPVSAGRPITGRLLATPGRRLRPCTTGRLPLTASTCCWRTARRCLLNASCSPPTTCPTTARRPLLLVDQCSPWTTQRLPLAAQYWPPATHRLVLLA